MTTGGFRRACFRVMWTRGCHAVAYRTRCRIARGTLMDDDHLNSFKDLRRIKFADLRPSSPTKSNPSRKFQPWTQFSLLIRDHHQTKSLRCSSLSPLLLRPWQQQLQAAMAAAASKTKKSLKKSAAQTSLLQKALLLQTTPVLLLGIF
jgi:hypothetical protein